MTAPISPDGHASEPVRYPANHVVGIIDSPEQVNAIVPELLANGFMESEVHVHCGAERAEAVNASTGRKGLANLMIRIAERLGIEDIEMERKEKYEQAMRDGRYVILIATPTTERKDRAAELMTQHGAHSMSFHGRFTIETILPPNA